MEKERIDKLISLQFGISRNESKQNIRKGLVSIDGNIVKDSSIQVDTCLNSVLYNGQRVIYKKNVYLIMNKPDNILSASTDKHKKTVVDLVRDDYKKRNLFPVGRLDKNTTGLLILTDDGDFAHNVISPVKMIYKTYLAELDGIITDETIKLFDNGIILADGTACRKAILKKISDKVALVSISEGKYHQIKRMFGVAGLGVESLKRLSIGRLYLPDNLNYGDYYEISKEEIVELIFK